MIRPRQIRLKLNRSTFQHCQELSKESAHVWNTIKNFFWRTDPSQAQDKKGIWLSESSMKRYVNGRFALHSQSIQAIIEKFYDNLKAARSLRKDNPSIRYPYKNKDWFCIHIFVFLTVDCQKNKTLEKECYTGFWSLYLSFQWKRSSRNNI
jgi:putative transposase